VALRRANVRVEERRGLFGVLRAVRLWVGRTAHFDIDRRAWQRLAAGGEPLLVGSVEGRRLWATADGCYWAEPGLEAEAVALLLWDRGRRQEARLDRLRKIRAADTDTERARRERIPDEVRAAVWLRDGGRCVRCGAEADLQFDHVIAVARGGGGASPNIQVLCGACNRAKGDAIV
jgi:5-methylcytosine-specific restriction endonuclease McrA